MKGPKMKGVVKQPKDHPAAKRNQAWGGESEEQYNPPKYKAIKQELRDNDGKGHVMVPDGKRMDLETHQQMHRALCDESHHRQSLQVVQVGDHPERAYAAGQVNWEASFADGRPGRIKAAVEEQWLLERGSDGVLRWVHYRSRVVDFAPDSAPLEI